MKCSKKYFSKLFFLVIVIVPSLLFSQVLLKADKTVDTYELIRSKGLKLEVPDCVHHVKHVSEAWDDQLKEYVLVFDSHVNLDNDRCRGFDRIRTELTVTDSLPPPYLGAHDSDTFTYLWKFKLDSGFVGNKNFCHIHQIKAVGGGDDGMPMITLTTRAGKPDTLQLIFSPAKGNGREIILKSEDLAQFKGVWIEVVETVNYNVNGWYSIILKRVSDGKTLFSYTNNEIGLSRSGAYFYRPKIGIYRSLKNKSEIRDESVRFTDFCIIKGNAQCSDLENYNLAPAKPTEVNAISLSNTQIILQWYDNSFNEDHFRIERSTNETEWSLAALVTSGWERWKPQTQILSFIDTSLLPGTKYYYRIRAENLFGSSSYSNTVSTSIENTTGEEVVKNIPVELELQSNPNPFSNSTQLSYQIPIASQIRLIIYDSLGVKMETLLDEFKEVGKYNYTLNTNDMNGRQLTIGTYFARLQAGEYTRILKLYLKE